MAFIGAWPGGKAVGFEEAFGCRDLTRSSMQRAIAGWYDLYYDGHVTHRRDASQRLPYTIVCKLSKTVFSEYRAALVGQGEMSEGLAAALQALDEQKNHALQHALIGGECLLKPVILGGRWEAEQTAEEKSEARGRFGAMGRKEMVKPPVRWKLGAAAGGGKPRIGFAVVRRPHYAVLACDGQGRPTAYGTAEHTVAGRAHYTLLEKRSTDELGRVVIESKLFCSDRHGGPGRCVPLQTLEKYRWLEPKIVLPTPMENCGFVRLKMPMENCVDGSESGVSVYAAAVGAIEAAYRLEAQLNREFENAASRILASADLLTPAANGGQALQEDLFLALDDEPDAVGITVFSPPIREASFLRRKNDCLRTIENIVGMKRGILSEVEAEERTATEITSSEGDYSLTIQSLQNAWSDTVRSAMRVCAAMGRMYLGWNEGPGGELALAYGDGVLFNREEAQQHTVQRWVL